MQSLTLHLLSPKFLDKSTQRESNNTYKRIPKCEGNGQDQSQSEGSLPRCWLHYVGYTCTFLQEKSGHEFALVQCSESVCPEG